jgi:hypothetical protein
MTEKRTVLGIGPGNVRQFLDACLAPPLPEDQGNETTRLGQLLEEQLAEKGPAPQAPVRSGSWLLDRVQEKVLLGLSRPVREVLLGDPTDLGTLRDIKDRYKKWAEKASDKDMQRVYTALYFAAIARALVSHAKRITRHPPAYLTHSFGVLAGEPWMASALRELYLEAQRICEQGPQV